VVDGQKADTLSKALEAAPDSTARPMIQELERGQFIRGRLFDEQKSNVAKYRELVIGRGGVLSLIHYELLTSLLAPVPGALGLFLRSRFYRGLFRRAGTGLIIGRNVVIRHADNMSLGHRVVVDDQAVLDARGAGVDGLFIGNEVIIGRGAMIVSKYGPVVIGEQTNIGSNTVVCAMGRITIGKSVLIAGGCYISGGLYHTDRIDMPIAEQGIYTRGPVEIGDGSWLGMGVIVVDGVKIGKGCVVAAGAVVTRSLPDYAVAAGVPAVVKRIRELEHSTPSTPTR